MGGTATDYKLGKLNGRKVITWWEGGQRHRFRLRDGITSAEATAQLTQFIKSRELLLDREEMTISAIVKLYIKDREIDEKETDKQSYSWKALEPFFGALSPDDVEKELCDAYRDHRKALGRKEGTIWTELSVL